MSTEDDGKSLFALSNHPSVKGHAWIFDDVTTETTRMSLHFESEADALVDAFREIGPTLLDSDICTLHLTDQNKERLAMIALAFDEIERLESE